MYCTSPTGYKERGEYLVFSFQIGAWKSKYKISAAAQNRKSGWQRYLFPVSTARKKKKNKPEFYIGRIR